MSRPASSARRRSTPSSARSSPAQSRAASGWTRPSCSGIAASASATSRSGTPCWRRPSGWGSASSCATRNGGKAVVELKIDFGKAASDYAVHRQGFPPLLFDRLATLGVGLPGQSVLDLGTGTGLLARDFARRGCRVTGLDPSQALLAQARLADQAAAVSVDYVVGR